MDRYEARRFGKARQSDSESYEVKIKFSLSKKTTDFAQASAPNAHNRRRTSIEAIRTLFPNCAKGPPGAA